MGRYNCPDCGDFEARALFYKSRCNAWKSLAKRYLAIITVQGKVMQGLSEILDIYIERGKQ